MGPVAEEPASQADEETAAMNAVFAAADETVPTAQSPEPPATPDQSAATEPDPTVPTAQSPEPPAAQVPEPEYARITKAQWDQVNTALATMPDLRAGVEKVRRDTFGKIGGIEGLIKQIQTATPAGEPVTLSKEDFPQRTREDYPELLDDIIEGLNKRLAKGRVTGTATELLTSSEAAPSSTTPPAERVVSPDPTEVEKLVERGIAQKKGEIQMDVMRPDWRTIVGLYGPNGEMPPATPFRHWLATQSADYRATLEQTDNAQVLTAAITRFEQETAKQQSAPAQDPRRTRLAAAVPPKGDNQPPTVKGEPTEQEALVASFYGKKA